MHSRRNAVRKRKREGERALSVIASVYIVPLASGVSRTAFVFDLLRRRGSRGRALRDRFDPRPLARVAGFRRNVLFPFSQIKARIADKSTLNSHLRITLAINKGNLNRH